MKIKIIIKYLLSGFLFWMLIHLVIISIDGLTDTRRTADVAVILGNKVNMDGSLSDRLEKRLECGLCLFKAGKVKRIIVSGGLGKEGFYEAEKMKVFLIDNDVPDSLIIVDNYGVNTSSTAVNVVKINNKHHFESFIVVSQFYHVTRTKMLFRKYGLKNTSSSCPKYFEIRDVYSLFREFFAFYADLLFL